jgi:hypothetical protein
VPVGDSLRLPYQELNFSKDKRENTNYRDHLTLSSIDFRLDAYLCTSEF